MLSWDYKKSNLGWELLTLKAPLQGREQKRRQSFYAFLKIWRAVLWASEATVSSLAGTQAGSDPQSQVAPEGIKKMPGIQEPTLNWTSALPFLFFRGREIQLCLRKYVYFCCEGNVAWFIFVYKVSIFHFSKWKGGKADRERLLWGKFFFSSLSLFFKKLNCSRGQSWPWTLKKYWDDRKSLCWRSRDRYASDFIHSVAHRQSLVQSPPQI